jgi:glutamine amidotransferase
MSNAVRCRRLALIDYGAGNLTSVRKAFAAIGVDSATPQSPLDLDAYAGIVIPGVGNYRATRTLDDAWRAAILRRVAAGAPLLGICLGMQLLYESSDEAPDTPGLGLVPGRCRRIEAERPLKVPHVGWNSISIRTAGAILAGVENGTYVYFTHSYAAPVTGASAATATHGTSFAAVVERGNVAGVQFHPEKSGATGLQILRNFARMTVRR